MKRMNKFIQTDNPILATDSYKYSHFLQYPPGTEYVSSYIEARAGGKFEEVTFFGLQPFLRKMTLRGVELRDVEEANEFVTSHGLPFNYEGWKKIATKHSGALPIQIQALPEGMTVPVGTPLVQVRNTDPEFPWLTSFIETALLRAVWYPSTVATLSRAAKKIIYRGLLVSSDDPDGQINFKLHDFGARGATSAESAGIGGAAHLINFMGTDTIEGLIYARNYYDAGMAGFSIPAAEHSTITTWGRDKERDAYQNMLDQFAKPGKLVAVVSDSYDIYNAVQNLWGAWLRDGVRDSGATVVIRPDSGDPVKTPLRVIELLAKDFGYTVNSKGYKVLDKSVRVIQGDGMDLESIRTLISTLVSSGWSIDNIAVGMGGGLLQKVNRDTVKFAMKANEVVINGHAKPVSKAPVGDPSKASKAGRQAVVRVNPTVFGTASIAEADLNGRENLLKTVWERGVPQSWTTFDGVRQRALLPEQIERQERAA